MTIPLGYYTSQNGGIFISEKQIKQFQNEKLNGTVEIKSSDNIFKKQYFFFLKKDILFLSCKKEKTFLYKYDKDYMQSLDEKITSALNEHYQYLYNLPEYPFPRDGVTKPIVKQICNAFDYNAKNQLSHPISAIEKEKASAAAAKEAQQLRQIDKNHKDMNKKLNIIHGLHGPINKPNN